MSSWSALAEAYHHFVGSDRDRLRTEVLYPSLWRTMGELSGKQLLDIGCGNGYFAHHAADKGAQVSAFDNQAMINVAEKHFAHPRIRYQAHDATQTFPYPDDTFDLVTANLVLMDIKKIDSLLSEAARVLKATGSIWISILHPCFTPPVGKFRRGIMGRIQRKYAYFHLKDYLNAPERTFKRSFGSSLPATEYFHRTISDYSHYFARHNLAIAAMDEPRPSDLFLQKHPRFFHASKISIFLVFQLKVLP